MYASHCTTDARWFTRSEIQTVLAHPQGARLSRKDYRRFDEEESKIASEKAGTSTSGQATTTPAAKEETKEDDLPPFRVPPSSAIAGVLIRDWVEGKIGSGGWRGRKNNL